MLQRFCRNCRDGWILIMLIQLQHWWPFNGSLRLHGFFGREWLCGKRCATLKRMRWVIHDVFLLGKTAEVENGSCMRSKLKKGCFGGWFAFSQGCFFLKCDVTCEQIQIWVVLHWMMTRIRISGTTINIVSNMFVVFALSLTSTPPCSWVLQQNSIDYSLSR